MARREGDHGDRTGVLNRAVGIYRRTFDRAINTAHITSYAVKNCKAVNNYKAEKKKKKKKQKKQRKKKKKKKKKKQKKKQKKTQKNKKKKEEKEEAETVSENTKNKYGEN